MPILDKIRPARIDEIRREETSDLYVLNNAQANPALRDGLIIFNVAIDVNDRRIVRVPNTWVPINIGHQIPKDLIMRSPDFLDAVMRRVIILIKTTDAEQIFEDDAEARAEWDKISQDLSGRFTGDIDGMQMPPGTVIADVEGAIDPDINTQLAEAVSREDIAEQDLMSIVRNLTERGNLKRKDYEFILANTQYNRVREIATNNLAKMPRSTVGRQPRMS